MPYHGEDRFVEVTNEVLPTAEQAAEMLMETGETGDFRPEETLMITHCIFMSCSKIWWIHG
jgi:hypothetical protein